MTATTSAVTKEAGQRRFTSRVAGFSSLRPLVTLPCEFALGSRRAGWELFFVIATENPVEFRGTYPLPEAQMDRFALQFKLGYVPPEDEVAVLAAQERLAFVIKEVRRRHGRQVRPQMVLPDAVRHSIQTAKREMGQT